MADLDFNKYMQNFQNYGLGAGIGGGIGGLLGSLFMKDPSTAANKYYGQMEKQTGQYLNPYIQQGLGSMGQLGGQYGNLINDPSAMLAKFGAGYKQSPGFQNQMKQALAGAGHAAAAGGMAGSPQHEQQNMELASDLSAKDYNNYMNQVMGLYGQGLQGQQGLANMGFGASRDMANNIAQMLEQQAQAAYQQQASKRSGFSNFISGLGGLAGLKFF
jgi:hypothetical protein